MSTFRHATLHFFSPGQFLEPGPQRRFAAAVLLGQRFVGGDGGGKAQHLWAQFPEGRFGLLSSVFDYLTFGELLYFMKAGEKVFQTGWFIESVVSASLIVLVVRTRLPFLKSPPGKYLAIATALIVAAYIGSAEAAKQWFYKKLKNNG
jgi:hypothetical protein